MTRTISLITGIAVTALVFGVPTAVGKGGPGSPQPPAAVKYFYANERATLTPAPEPVMHDHGDASQAKLLAQSSSIDVMRDHGDATQAKLTWLSAPVVARESAQRIDRRSTPPVVRDHGDATQAKLVAQSSGIGATGEVEATSSSGSDFNWSQLGIGFGVGIFLVGGVILAVQFTRNQRLAH
jgi:hypothetical protein